MLSPVHPVTQRLREAGITSAVVIDDAYNPPEYDDLRAEISEFWAGIVREDSALAELKAMKPDLESEDDIDEELVNELWTRTLREELSSLCMPCESILFSRQLEGHSELAAFVSNLSRIGIAPILIGTSENLPDGELKLFFLDFFLGPKLAPPGSAAVEKAIQQLVAGTAEHPSIQASIDKAKEILKRSDDAFIVLMSSNEGVEQARDSFREHTGLIEGMFDYASKRQLANERELHLRLGVSAMGLPVRHDIQRFVTALEASVQEASGAFITQMKSLSFEDYLYIYSLSLRAEGQPLGTYMSGLYKSLLAHLVHNSEKVIETQNKLDTIDVASYVPLKRAPSIHLANIYSKSLTEPGMQAEAPYLRLGDLYVRGTQDVLLVINADCDLIHSPQSPSRSFPEDLSIMLHPGRLKPVEEPVKQEYKVTNLFVLEGQAYKIVWYHEGVISKKYGEVRGWLAGEGFSRRGRLIGPHALEIQQHFAASLTRVGMPVAPPLSRLATIRVLAKKQDETLAQLGEDIPRGVVIDQGRFRFTVDGFGQLLERVLGGIEHYKALRDGYNEGHGRFTRLQRNVERLEALLEDRSEWFAIIEDSYGMPNRNGSQVGSKGILQVFCNPELETAESIIVCNLILDEWDIGEPANS